MAVEHLAAAVLRGERSAIARALTVVERAEEPAHRLIGAIFKRTGRAHLVGVTGGAGVGKSSLIAELAKHWRARRRSVAVLAVDPTSARSGGALLGDRVRLEGLADDHGFFARSMATRGATGGLAATTADATRVLDAAGFDIVVVETIGAGQDQVAVAQVVETLVVVDAPNLGDDVQAMKAGLLEESDVYVVAKADLPGADRTAAALRASLSLGSTSTLPPVLLASTVTGVGIEALANAIDEHGTWLAGNPEARQAHARLRAAAELSRRLRDELWRRHHDAAGSEALAAAAAGVASGEIDPYAAVEALISAAGWRSARRSSARSSARSRLT